MSEQQNGEHVASSAEQQPAQPVEHVQPEPTPAETPAVESAPAPAEPTFGTPAVDDPDLNPDAVQPEPAGGNAVDADEPNADERDAAGDGEVTQPNPYSSPGFGVTGKFVQDEGDDAEGDRA